MEPEWCRGIPSNHRYQRALRSVGGLTRCPVYVQAQSLGGYLVEASGMTGDRVFEQIKNFFPQSLESRMFFPGRLGVAAKNSTGILEFNDMNSRWVPLPTWAKTHVVRMSLFGSPDYQFLIFTIPDRQ